MITFCEVFEVKDKVDKSVPRKDGNGTFDFTEVELESDEKKPTTIIARLVNNEMEVAIGKKYDMRICISSFKARDGRVWNNFAVMGAKPSDNQKSDPAEHESLYDDEIPF